MDQCREFTPQLAKVYTALRGAGRSLEIVYVSHFDSSDEEFVEFFAEMPWLAIPYGDARTRTDLGKHFGVDFIPQLFLFEPDGTLVTREGHEIAVLGATYGLKCCSISESFDEAAHGKARAAEAARQAAEQAKADVTAAEDEGFVGRMLKSLQKKADKAREAADAAREAAEPEPLGGVGEVGEVAGEEGDAKSSDIEPKTEVTPGMAGHKRKGESPEEP